MNEVNPIDSHTPNPIGLQGIEFAEFSSPNPENLHRLFLEFGFSRTHRHETKQIDLYVQNGIRFLLNTEPTSFAENFYKSHGPSLPSMGWKVSHAASALKTAIFKGAKEEKGDYLIGGTALPALSGIGGSLIYLVEEKNREKFYSQLGFKPLAQPDFVSDKGFLEIDHLTNNVPKGTMQDWTAFYKNIFGFTQVRYFDIRGAKTGLTSFALRSPDGSFCIPINEGNEEKSQINEYLREYKGAGVQHIAFSTKDIIRSVAALKSTKIETLDIDDEYYAEVFGRVPNVTEDHKKLHELNILVDGDNEGYLLQIFTKNVIGPIFIEIIQRKNHFSFGEGNFGALFRSIERDQQKRGVL